MSQQVARTILEQLGGNRFAVMTGSKNFTASPNSLSFKVGRNAKKVSHVKIELTPMDDYTVSFLSLRNLEIKELAKHEGVYCDQLQDLFCEETGMFTRL